MLILLTAWVVHNWWKLLLGVAAIVVILEYHYYKKPAKEKTGREAEETEEGDILRWSRLWKRIDRKQDKRMLRGCLPGSAVRDTGPPAYGFKHSLPGSQDNRHSYINGDRKDVAQYGPSDGREIQEKSAEGVRYKRQVLCTCR